MKFRGLRKFSGKTSEDALNYLRVDVSKALADLFEGLTHIALGDNFDHFLVEVSLAAGADAKYLNRLRTPDLKWWPVRITGDNRLVEAQAFDRNYVYIQNAGSTAITATLIFVR